MSWAVSLMYLFLSRRLTGLQVLMNLQLYMVDSVNYLVDFHHKGSYRASTEPGVNKYDPMAPDALSEAGSESKDGRDEIVSPFVFMDVACRLILELAGGGE